MSEEGPKLYTNKPKKAQLKQGQAKLKDFTVPPSSSSSTAAAAAAASYSMGSQGGSAPPPPPPPPPKESFARRYKFLWPLLLTVNLAVGGYIFLRTKKKDTAPTDEETARQSDPMAKTAPVAAENLVSAPAAVEPVKVREPVPEKQQRELFKWMLEEKRKVKPKDAEEKKRIDEEKAILKQFIRAKTIPSL